MKTKKAGLRIIFAAFAAVICLSWIFWFFLEKFTDTTNYENRQMQAQPRLTLDTYRQFSADYTNYFNDSIPFRNSLITLNNAIDYFVFQKSSDDRVIVGSDRWLFYCDEQDGDSVAAYQGNNLLPEEELERIAENCVRQQQYVEGLGKEFVLFIAPNKERVYSDKMPREYGEPAENYRVLQVVNYLKENTDVRVVYPYAELMEARKILKEDVYYKTDTHWNAVGAYIGTAALLRELGIEMPEISSDQIKINQIGDYTGDLAGFLGLAQLLKSAAKEYTVEGYDTHQAAYQFGDYNGEFLLYYAEDADPRILYLVGDSFAASMLPYLNSQFNESTFRHRSSYNYDDFYLQDPDIFVYETVERYIDWLGKLRVNGW